MSRIRASVIAAALRFGRNSFASAFKLVSSWSFISLAGTSQWSSNGYRSWIGRTRNVVPTCIWTALTTSSFQVYNCDTLPIFQYLCSLIHLWWLRCHQYLLSLLNLCDWDCISLEVLLGIHVSIFSTGTLYMVVYIFILSSICLNRRLQWDLLFSHLFKELCCLVLIRLTRWRPQRKLRGNCSNWCQRQAVFLQVLS